MKKRKSKILVLLAIFLTCTVFLISGTNKIMVPEEDLIAARLEGRISVEGEVKAKVNQVTPNIKDPVISGGGSASTQNNSSSSSANLSQTEAKKQVNNSVNAASASLSRVKSAWSNYTSLKKAANSDYKKAKSKHTSAVNARTKANKTTNKDTAGGILSRTKKAVELGKDASSLANKANSSISKALSAAERAKAEATEAVKTANRAVAVANDAKENVDKAKSILNSAKNYLTKSNDAIKSVRSVGKDTISIINSNSKMNAMLKVEKAEAQDMKDVIDLAYKIKGKVKYVYGGNSYTGALDCSSYVQNVYKRSINVTLPRTSVEQSKKGNNVKSISSLRPGDTVFFSSGGRVYHVGIYRGGENKQMIHNSKPGRNVVVSEITASYYSKGFNNGRRTVKTRGYIYSTIKSPY